MQSNSKVIGVVVCIVCCIGALCILPLAGSSDNDLQGWNSSQMYDGLINPSDSEFFTDAVLEERANGGLASTPHISSTGSRMFHHGGASTMSMPAGATTLSYAGASVHTTSSAAMSGTGSSISPISTSTATGSMSGSSMGGGAIYATSNSVSPRSGSASGSSLISSSALSAPTASRATAPMMSASSATSGNPSAMYASNMSSNYGTASYGGYTGPKGVRGRQGAQGIGGGWSNMFYELIYGIKNNNPDFSQWSDIWLQGYDDWNGDGMNDDGLEYFNYSRLKEYFYQYFTGKMGGDINPSDLDELWNEFLLWMEAGKQGSANGGTDHIFRFPIPDGVGVLLVLSLLCVLFTFLRSRDKKILEESNNQ